MYNNIVHSYLETINIPGIEIQSNKKENTFLRNIRYAVKDTQIYDYLHYISLSDILFIYNFKTIYFKSETNV